MLSIGNKNYNNKKIAIFHNIEKGGGLLLVSKFIKYLSTHGAIVDLYSHNNNIDPKYINKTNVELLNHTSNIFQHLYQALWESSYKQNKLAKLVANGNYDLIVVFPCLLTQAPHILRFLPPKKTIYVFNEPKREFYENTSYDHNTFKRRLARIIRMPIKYLDIINTKSAKNIVSISHYSDKQLYRIYSKKSIAVIYPGMKKIKPKKIRVHNNKKILSIGLLSKIKGHDFSIRMIAASAIKDKQITILRREEKNDTVYLERLSKRLGVKLNIIKTENDNEKNKIIKQHSIYLANNENEPFGIATLEALQQERLVLGKNEGGTKEIVNNGINGYLYNDIKSAIKTLNKFYFKSYFDLFKTTTIDWSQFGEKLITIYNKLNNEPTD